MSKVIYAKELSSLCNLEDLRLNQRLETMLVQMGNDVLKSFNSLPIDKFQKKAYYRFINNKKVESENLMLAYRDYSVKQALQSGNVILSIQDTTELDYTGSRSDAHLGSIQYENRKGLYLHNHLLVNDLGIPLGLFSQQYYNYDLATLGKAKSREYIDITEKHSYRWLEEFENLQEQFKNNTDKIVISLSDRESDIHELLEARKHDHIHYIIRNKFNRLLEFPSEEASKVWDLVGQTPVVFNYNLNVATKKDRNLFREAHLEVRYSQATIKPTYRKTRELSPVDLWIVEVSEIDVPEGEERICWRLFTSMAIEDAETAKKIIDYYVIRWVIERFHYVLKQGAKVEALQITSVEALKNAITLHSWQAVDVCKLAYESNLSPTSSLESVGFSKEDYQIAFLYVRQKINKNLVAIDCPNLLDFARLIVQIGGGVLHKKRRIPVVSLWKGWSNFLLIKDVWQMKKDFEV